MSSKKRALAWMARYGMGIGAVVYGGLSLAFRHGSQPLWGLPASYWFCLWVILGLMAIIVNRIDP